MQVRRVLSSGFGAAAALLLAVTHAPEALAFPYRAQVGRHQVWSVRPLEAGPLRVALARADALVAASPIADGGEGRRIFLTDGGWRWRLLALNSSGGFAVSRALPETIILNDTDVGAGLVRDPQPIGNRRALSGVLAHEMTHAFIRRRFGLAADMVYPAWLREGYCDHVAGSSSLSDREAAGLIAGGRTLPALGYYLGRKRVEARLAQLHGNVEALFAHPDG